MEVFDLNNYIEKDYVMHCNTREKAQVFLRYLHSMGCKWISGSSYVNDDCWGSYIYQTVYYFNEGKYGNLPAAIEDGRYILEFDDFDWPGSDIIVATFTPGDRVRVTKLGAMLYGESGTVRVVEDSIGVEFDQTYPALHELNGRCRNGRGWWFDASDLELARQHKGEDLLAILK